MTSIGHKSAGKDRRDRLRESEGKELYARLGSGGGVGSLGIEGNIIEFLSSRLAFFLPTRSSKRAWLLMAFGIYHVARSVT